MLKLQPSHPFSEVGPGSVMPRGSISLPITFGTLENYDTESFLFNITEVNLHFNAIQGRSALYQFMAIAHYGYPVLKIPLPSSNIKIHGDCDVGIFWRSSKP
jgi:hypothetical protein